MTREEAIKELREASDSEVRYGDTEHHYDEVMKRVESFEMAIKALEIVEEFETAQIITDGRLNGRTNAYKKGLEDGERKALEQEWCDKCIYSTSKGECQYDDIAETIPTEQEPCEDCISRRAVLDIDFNRICLTTAKPAEMIREIVSGLPSYEAKMESEG